MNIRNIVIGLGVIVFACGLFYKEQSTGQHAASKRQVALILPAVHPSMEAIQEGFVSTLREFMPHVEVVVYNANGNKTLMKGQAEKIVRQRYDACCAVGTNASTMLATVLQKNDSKMPLIAVAVSPEVSERLIGSYNKVTGITDQVDKKKQIEVLLALKEIKNPVLVYDPASNPGFEKDREEYLNIFKKYGIVLSALPVNSIQEVYQKLSGTITSYDLVLTLTDHTVCAAMDAIIKLCNQHGVTLYTSELDSNDKGAALSYGVSEREYGVKAAQLLGKVYENEYIPHFEKSGPFYLKINKEAAALQKVALSGNILLSGMKIVYQGDVHD